VGRREGATEGVCVLVNLRGKVSGGHLPESERRDMKHPWGCPPPKKSSGWGAPPATMVPLPAPRVPVIPRTRGGRRAAALIYA